MSIASLVGMNPSGIRRSGSFLVGGAAFAAVLCGFVIAAPTDYESMSAGDLVAQAGRLALGSNTDAGETAESVAARAVELLLQEDTWENETNSTMLRLVELAGPQLNSLTADEREALTELVQAARSEAPGMSFEELRSRVGVGTAAGIPQSAINGLVESWLAGRDINELGLPELQFCLEHSLPNETERREFSVTWTGLLTPPLPGSYQFSVSPINVNRQGRDAVKHRVKVVIANKEVLDTTPDPPQGEIPPPSERGPRRPLPPAPPKWQWEGEEVELQPGNAVPITVTLEYSCTEPSADHSPSALLFWEGPALDRQAVHERFLTGPQGGGGLKTEYSWPTKGEQRLVVAESANVDFVWSTPARVAPVNQSLVSQLACRIFELGTDPSYLDDCASGGSQHCYFENAASANALSSLQRQEFLKLLVASPELLQRIDKRQIVDVYRRFRFGAEEEALDLLGHWLQLDPDVVPQISVSFFEENRHVHWELARLVAHQLPAHCEDLQNGFLEMEDGRCALPVAYTLSYANLARDQTRPSSIDPMQYGTRQNAFSAWVRFLTDELGDESLTGDLRINWLLARAQAAESKVEPMLSHPTGREILSAGQSWLDEAQLVSESDKTGKRVTLESVARLAAYRMWSDASMLISERLPSDDAAVWQTKLELVRARVESVTDQERQRLMKSRVTEYEKRRQKAVDRGDEVAESRYTAIIERLQRSSD